MLYGRATTLLRQWSHRTIRHWVRSWKPFLIRDSGRRLRFLSSKMMRRTGPITSIAAEPLVSLCSPYIQRGIVDSTMYTTASMIHTMELILGLPPMTQFDRAATPMYKAFSTQIRITPRTTIPSTNGSFREKPGERARSRGFTAARFFRIRSSGPGRNESNPLERNEARCCHASARPQRVP